MKTLLQIRASIFSDGGQSSRLAERFVSQWRALNHRGEVITRDLARDPVPHLTAERFQAFLAKPGERTLPQEADVAYSDALIGELERADVIVIGLPMYNFGVPSALKAYFDHIARARPLPDCAGFLRLLSRGKSIAIEERSDEARRLFWKWIVTQ